ncbi:CoA transferase subunit A [Gulosibacter molinativorax]|uniref:CoA transferase subunit A n=1 Tax=Gulosibacter molinativorax TaxID=256821 RepID=UPI000416B5C8|nr:3-oxoadipate--succinyl-CoA transferase [Gulosibacter molinativorax]QUY61025.1 3-oxoadipate CoA-transferase [Gulosibacter molinativorax]
MDKTTSLHDAIAKYVRPGMTIALEGFGHLVPVAAAHEIIRQRIQGLTLARMSGELFIDQLLAGECLDKIIISFMGNSSAGSLQEVRRRVEKQYPRSLEIEEYSHGGLVARYLAGASKLPFMPTKSYRGSDMVVGHEGIREVIDPFTGESFYAVAPLNPDVSIIHAQRADRHGNVQAWGILGMQQEVAFAGRKVIVTVEEIVDDEVIRSDPNRTIVPATIVDAVVEVPWGSFPSSVQGYYSRDDAFIRQWAELARDHDQIVEWLDTNIHATASYAEWVALQEPQRWRELAVTPQYSQPVNYGSR